MGNFLPEFGQNPPLNPGGALPVPPLLSQVGEGARLDPGWMPGGGDQGPHPSETLVRQWGRATFGEHKVNGRCRMSKQSMTGAPVCTWVSVTDASGRTRMEARWTAVNTAATRAA